MSEEVEYSSALEENISRKGSNAYYYAHGKKIDGPAWDGKEEPRLLSVSDSTKVVSRLAFTPLDSYSWLDGKKVVKIYVDFEQADQVEDDKISVVTEEKSVEFKFTAPNGKTHILTLNNLNNSIDGASFKKKPDQFILSLNKSTETSWYQLKSSSS